jgi:hypothetical protein
MKTHGGTVIETTEQRDRRLLRETIVYLREVDAGTDNACWIVCNKVDEGAVPFGPLT